MDQDGVLTNQNPAEIVSPAAEPMVPQSKVNEIIKTRTAQVAEKTRLETLASMQSQAPVATMNQAEVLEAVAREAKRYFEDAELKRRQEHSMQEAHRVVNEFMGKMQRGKSEYDDFDSVTKNLQFDTIPHVVNLANSVDNTAAVMRELAKNPSKIASLTMLSQMDPKLAQQEMLALSQSIKVNEGGAKQKVADAPLSQLTPTTAGADNGVMSTNDWRKHPSWRV